MHGEALAKRLADGLCEISGLAVEVEQADKLLSFIDLLQRWNKTYNLTAIRNPGDMVTRHLLDSLAVMPWIGPGRLLDAGTGAGLPGIPLAICQPELDVTLLDSAGKKVRFLNHVCRELELTNAHPVQQRLEKYVPERAFDTVISRAFASLNDFVQAAAHLACPRLLAMKGKHPENELKALDGRVRVVGVEKIKVPGLQEDRHLVIMSGNHES